VVARFGSAGFLRCRARGSRRTVAAQRASENAVPKAVLHPGCWLIGRGLYEVLLAALVFAIVWPLRNRLRRPTTLTWLVLALFSIGRFFEFFARSDSEGDTFGLSTAQWTSLVLLAIAVIGASITLRRQGPRARTSAGAPIRDRASARVRAASASPPDGTPG
jgi:prolipoprotein diacylglyceryltransferase